MAINFEYPLTNSLGMRKVVSFEGLEFPIIIAPTLHGEPLLTTQAFYFLSRLESAAKIRFENPNSIPEHDSQEKLERRLEYVIDNYLFEYSRKYPDERLTSKITNLKYWKNDGLTFLGYDNNNTIALALDTLNDESIINVSNEDFPNKDYWNDWCLVANYTNEYIENYINSMKNLLDKKVNVETVNHDELGTGKFELPLVQLDESILTYHQALMLEVLSTGNIQEKDGKVIISRGIKMSGDFSLPLEKMNVNKYYDAELLSYYFAGVREHLPISKFRCFYNVLEYLFEEAPTQLGERAKNEREQISCVVRWVSANFSILNFIESKGEKYKNKVQEEMIPSSGVKINALPISPLDIERNTAKWLYDIRCAIIHSKKTIRGNVDARFVPYSNDEKLADIAIPIIQQLAILCIEKDESLITT